jgi:hypothetical protein
MNLLHTFKLYLGITFKWLRPLFLTQKEQEKVNLIELRASFKLFDFDTSHLSDQDIIDGVILMSNEISKSGVTAQEFVNAAETLDWLEIKLDKDI